MSSFDLIGGSSSYSYYLNDHLATPQKMISSNGATVWQADYESFGKATVKTNTIENNLRFPGQYYDVETGEHYNCQRNYMPGIGRYNKVDPIGFKSKDYNLYRYVRNRPTIVIDFSGLTVYSCEGKVKDFEHAWLCLDDKCAGNMPKDKWGVIFGHMGIITSDYGYLEEFCDEVKLGKCEKKDTFERCIKEEAINRVGQEEPYQILYQRCTQWRDRIISKCRAEART